MKRVSALILALMFLFLASCGTDAAPETTTEQANSCLLYTSDAADE